MANEVMAGLFGVTPEGLAAQREQALQKQALTFAQLDPAAQAQYQLFLGGNRLGGAIGGMLGAQDPELARVAQRQQLLQGVNPSDAASLREAASRALAAGDNQAAAMLGQRAMDVEMAGAKLTSEQALAKQRERERAAADPIAQFARVNADKFTPASLQEFAQSGKYSDLDPVTKPENIKNYQTQIVGVATGTNEPVYALTAPGEPPKQVVYKMVNGEQVAVPYTGGVDRSTAKTTITNQLKTPPDIAAAVSAFDKVAAPEVEMLTTVQRAKSLINDAAASNNSQSWEAARTTIAKAVGENKLSNEDIRRTGTDPRLVQGALDWANKKISGVPNQDIMKQLYVLSSILEKDAANRYDEKARRARQAGKDTGFSGDLDLYFPSANTRFNVKTPMTSAMPGSGGSGGVVDFNSLK
jgi:hypothetical protein